MTTSHGWAAALSSWSRETASRIKSGLDLGASSEAPPCALQPDLGSGLLRLSALRVVAVLNARTLLRSIFRRRVSDNRKRAVVGTSDTRDGRPTGVRHDTQARDGIVIGPLPLLRRETGFQRNFQDLAFDEKQTFSSDDGTAPLFNAQPTSHPQNRCGPIAGSQMGSFRLPVAPRRRKTESKTELAHPARVAPLASPKQQMTEKEVAAAEPVVEAADAAG